MAQAGNRAGKTQCYLQWWDSGAECLAVTAAKCKVCDRVLFFLFRLFVCLLGDMVKIRARRWCVRLFVHGMGAQLEDFVLLFFSRRVDTV